MSVICSRLVHKHTHRCIHCQYLVWEEESVFWQDLKYIDNHKVVLFSVFRSTSILFSIMAVPIYIPFKCTRVLSSPHLLITSYCVCVCVCVCVLTIAILTGMRWYLIVILIYMPLMISDTECIFFHISVGHLCVFGEMSIQNIAQIIIRFLIFHSGKEKEFLLYFGN